MSFFSGKMKKSRLVAVILAFVFLATAVIPASAASFEFTTDDDCDFGEIFDCTRLALEDFILTIIAGVGKLFALLLELTVKGIIFLIGYGTKMIGSEPVKQGFAATLGLTNLIFVIAIIIIAFATILRFENYGIKKMLPKLIIAALLVNFSLLIAGVLIDVSNVFTHYFLEGGVDAGSIGSAFNPQQLLGGGTFQLDDGQMERFLKALMIVTIAVIMTIVMVFVMAWVLFMVLIRNIWIAFLLILMPLIWGFWVLPVFSKHWTKWWENFIKWVIYLPSTTFFLWLAIKVAQTPAFNNAFQNKSLEIGTESLKNAALDGLITPTGDVSIFSYIIRMLIVLGLIVGGLKTGKAFGIIGGGALLAAGGFLAKAGMGVIGKGAMLPLRGAAAAVGGLAGGAAGLVAGKGDRLGTARRWAGNMFGFKRMAKTAGSLAKPAPLTLEGDAAAAPTFGNKVRAGLDALSGGNLYGRAANALSKKAAGLAYIPGMGAVSAFLAKTSASQSASIDEAREGVKPLSSEARQAWYKATKKMGIADKVAALLEAEENHELDKLSDAIGHDGMREYAQHAKTMNPGTAAENIDILKKIVAHDPTHAPDIMGAGHTVEKAARAATTGDIQQWSEATYRAVRQFLSPSQIKAYAGKDANAYNEVLAGAVNNLSGVVKHLDATRDAVLIKDFTDVGSGKRDGDLMQRVARHVKRLKDDKGLQEKFSDEEKESIDFAEELKRVVVRTKTKSEHAHHDYAGYRPSEGAKKLIRSLASAAGVPLSGGGGKGSSH